MRYNILYAYRLDGSIKGYFLDETTKPYPKRVWFKNDKNNIKSLNERMDEKILNIIATGEDYNTEFKEDFDKFLIESACAFANSSGGKLILGATDKGEIKGVDTSNKARSQIQNTLRQLQPQLDIKIHAEKKLIVIDVLTVQKNLMLAQEVSL